jgi:Holliday junction DNA helicase RuvA
VGDGRKTMEFSRALFDEGVLGTGIAFPTVPEGKARIRLMLTSEHTKAQLDQALETLERVAKRMGILWMIAHLRGKLIYKQPGQAIVEAAGVGYDVTISVPTFTALPSVGAEASLHIHTQVSEDQIALFGFLEREEKRLFERLITVSGVGPKLAIKILSGLSSERTVQAIRGQDHAQLTRIPGVGKKLAERLVVELKDKLDDFAVAPVRRVCRARRWTMCFLR